MESCKAKPQFRWVCLIEPYIQFCTPNGIKDQKSQTDDDSEKTPSERDPFAETLVSSLEI